MKSGDVGYIPKTFTSYTCGLDREEYVFFTLKVSTVLITFYFVRWYYGNISSEESDQFLLEDHIHKPGTFLVRASGSEPGEHALCLSEIDKHGSYFVHQWKIKRDSRGFFYFWRRKMFASIQMLVEYYKQKKLLVQACTRNLPRRLPPSVIWSSRIMSRLPYRDL